MRILEVRDGFIKFESEQKLALSAFVLINDALKSYIAQVIQVKRAGENSIVYAKLIYLYNGTLIDYDKSLPSCDSEIVDFSLDEICKNFEIKEPIILGEFIQKNQKTTIDKSFLDKKTLICIDSYDMNRCVVTNIANQFSNSLIIDTIGIYEKNKYVAGVDFKLPLNTDALDFMFEDCLNDATSDSKSLIKEIFQDLADYSKTVPFLPFGALKTIVDDMVEKSHIFKLLVLKNKLAKFDKLGYFAANLSEVENLNKILASKNAVIDLSKLDSTFQNRYISIILTAIEKLGIKTQVFIEASNTLNKKTLKKVLTGNTSTTFITHSRFKYINEIKSMFSNFIVEPTFANYETFKTYAIFLKSMPKDTFLLVGEGTSYIPLVSSAFENKGCVEPEFVDLEEALNNTDVISSDKKEPVDLSVEAIKETSNNLIEKVAEEVSSEVSPTAISLFEEEDNIEESITPTEIIETETETELNDEILEYTLEEVSSSEEKNKFAVPLSEDVDFHTRVDNFQTVEIPDDISEIAEEIEETLEEDEDVLIETIEKKEEEIPSEETLQNTSALEENNEEILEDEIADEPSQIINEEPEVISLGSDTNEDDFGEIIELDESELSEEDILVEFDESDTDRLEGEALDKAIVEDVDKVFTTMKEDSISDSDLDFIDELNGSVEEESEEIMLSEGMEELTDFQELEESDDLLEPVEEIQDYLEDAPEKEILEKRNSSTPIVPVYNAEIPQEDMVMSDPIEQGDVVVHAKYGNGVVEKMIKYGTKTLYSINFDNVGRRLLDPTLTELKKS